MKYITKKTENNILSLLQITDEKMTNQLNKEIDR